MTGLTGPGAALVAAAEWGCARCRLLGGLRAVAQMQRRYAIGWRPDLLVDLAGASADVSAAACEICADLQANRPEDVLHRHAVTPTAAPLAGALHAGLFDSGCSVCWLLRGLRTLAVQGVRLANAPRPDLWQPGTLEHLAVAALDVSVTALALQRPGAVHLRHTPGGNSPDLGGGS